MNGKWNIKEEEEEGKEANNVQNFTWNQCLWLVWIYRIFRHFVFVQQRPDKFQKQHICNFDWVSKKNSGMKCRIIRFNFHDSVLEMSESVSVCVCECIWCFGLNIVVVWGAKKEEKNTRNNKKTFKNLNWIWQTCHTPQPMPFSQNDFREFVYQCRIQCYPFPAQHIYVHISWLQLLCTFWFQANPEYILPITFVCLFACLLVCAYVCVWCCTRSSKIRRSMRKDCQTLSI